MKTSVRSTSLQSYEFDVLTVLGDRQRVVLEAMKNRENWTNSELAAYLNFPINTITPRVYELRRLGLVMEDGKRQCKVTGRTCISWMVVKSTLF